MPRFLGPWFGSGFVVLASLGACAATNAQDPPVLTMPPRSVAATTGSALLPRLRGLSLNDRETILAHEFAAGNVPDFLRRLVPVTTRATLGGRLREATFWCTPDYLGVGSDQDWFRMPMTPTLAQSIADRHDCILPTRRMVDAIWAAAPVKLAPFPYDPANYDILSIDLFHAHHLQIETQRGATPRSLLVAGIKKDVVASALIGAWPGRVVIYGWHYQNGNPIQPLSKVHTFGHVDYSHGIRLVARRMLVDGVVTTVDAVLADPLLHPLLSDEGAFASHRYPVATVETLPFRDTFPSSGPALGSWQVKFASPVSVPAVPAAPSGDPTVLRIQDAAGGTDSLRLRAGNVRDLAITADLLCEYRPQLASDGFERIGIFARDRADGAFDGTQRQQGACYALTWDSGDGRLRCLRANLGVLTDLLPSPRYLPSTAWRRFRIEAAGSRLRFHLDGELLLDVTDSTHPEGAFGIGFHEYFATNANMRGTRVDFFHADVPQPFAFLLRNAIGNGAVELRRERGIPGDWYFTALTLTPGAFPNGWFYGLDPNPDLLGAYLSSGHPAFLGRLDASGAGTVMFPGLPPGWALQGVSVAFDSSIRVLSPSLPVAMTTR
ncbi:MAG: hypothetical protein AB7I19_10855 [Planctomycetota bacterium]